MIPIELAIVRIRSEGEPMFTGHIRDISGRKRAEAELIESAKLGAVLAVLGFALNSEEPIEAVLSHYVEGLAHHLHDAYVCCWIADDRENVFKLEARGGESPGGGGPSEVVPLDGPGIGLIARDRSPYLTYALVDDPRVQDSAWAARGGLTTFVGYPLVVAGRVGGVLVIYARRVLSTAMLQALGPMAHGLAQYLERKRAQECSAAARIASGSCSSKCRGSSGRRTPGYGSCRPGAPGWDALTSCLSKARGRACRDISGPTTRSPPLVAHRRALLGESVSYEFRWMGMTYQCHVEPLSDRDGRTVGCIGLRSTSPGTGRWRRTSTRASWRCRSPARSSAGSSRNPRPRCPGSTSRGRPGRPSPRGGIITTTSTSPTGGSGS